MGDYNAARAAYHEVMQAITRDHGWEAMSVRRRMCSRCASGKRRC
jgi:hypothetical protein